MRQMRRLGWLTVLALGACGDNLLPDGVPLAASTDVVIVAHQDDDLLFMQPDLVDAVHRGGTTTVYVTAGNGKHGPDYSDSRYAGLRYAYGAAAGSNDWDCGWIEISGHLAEHCRLAEQQVSLVFLAYPDGGKYGEFDNSLLHLWEGTIDHAETVAHRTSTYTQDELIETVAEVLRETQPATVHTLDVQSTHGRDHIDHMIVGALAILAMARANSHADVIAYRGYAIAEEPANKLPAVYDRAFTMLTQYEACATSCGDCGTGCKDIDPAHVVWMNRRYATGFRRTGAGRLRTGTQCLTNELALGACETAPAWHIDRGGELRTDDNRCLTVAPTGDLSLADCLGGPERRFFADDEGHLWSGVPPAPEDGMDYRHLWCLAPTEAGGIHAELCGADHEPLWDLVPRTTATARADLGFSATGREVRLGDVDGDGRADLCTVDAAGLLCAIGDGTGGFLTPAERIDAAAMPLAIDPRSLTFGDVDGDHRADACGRDPDGILCATAATSFAAARWSPSFNDGVARTSTSPSLAILDADADNIADICGVDSAGVQCAPPGLTAPPLTRSVWPDATMLVWPADLDGDHRADWCAATDTGPACAVDAESAISTDGAAWGYARAGTVDIAPANSATVGLADIDGDGRADLCFPREDRILCARSQGRGFGPRSVTLAILPNQSVASALWLGDLDGDGRADACTDTGDSIVCAVEP